LAFGQAAPLDMGDDAPPGAQLLPKNSALFPEVIDRLLLKPPGPAGQRDGAERPEIRERPAMLPALGRNRDLGDYGVAPLAWAPPAANTRIGAQFELEMLGLRSGVTASLMAHKPGYTFVGQSVCLGDSLNVIRLGKMDP
jgi:hypothetical protein